jgi:hypothetical protein
MACWDCQSRRAASHYPEISRSTFGDSRRIVAQR